MTLTGLSGNEMYCLQLKGLSHGTLVVGNSVHSLGIIGNIGAGLKSAFGGEVEQLTQIIHEGRNSAYRRLHQEASQSKACGITGVTSELTHFRGNIEFLSVASCVHPSKTGTAYLDPVGPKLFSSCSNGQELYCQMDAGYSPRSFVFGNVAYSVGIIGGLFGSLRGLSRGEIPEFSQVFNHTRHLALERIIHEARAFKANSVVGIKTIIKPFSGVHEMMMLGTASYNPALPADCMVNPVTSDLSCEEMWNITAMGYIPVKLVLGTAVFSLGVVGGLKTMLQSFVKGEINDLTTLVYDAREHALGLIRQEAQAIGATDVVGVKTHIHDHGKLLEFMAIGTAIKPANVKTQNENLPAQAIIHDKDTWIQIGNALEASSSVARE